MPKEYIDREYYCNNICRCPGAECDKTKCTIWIAPAADVVPVVHGEWINCNGGNATCSHCKTRQKNVYDDENEQRFCGHCGAKMKVAPKEQEE